ncbi:tRNA (guanosine(37)-N1)-methyltransferase TrmD [Candidatus Omnitrophota bacterium]
MRIDILTIFPKMFKPILNESIVRRAQAKGKVSIFVHDLRDFSPDKHRKVDDRPFGGGPGMVMRPEPIFNAIKYISKKRQGTKGQAKKGLKVVMLTPRGRRLDQGIAKQLARSSRLVLICGHYEGIDERVKKGLVDQEISIGDYVLTGGELPAMVVVDCIVRLIPGVLGEKNSLHFESFEGNLLEYPQYTRPADYRGMRVPAVLVSGNHKRIERWKQAQAFEATKKRRPDLLGT